MTDPVSGLSQGGSVNSNRDTDGSAETETRDNLRAFQDRHLRLTLDWVRERSSFYAKRYAHVEEFRGIANLHRLPILRRDEIIENHADFLCDPGPPSKVQYTTGTTGTFLPLYRSETEVAFVREFFTRILQESGRLSCPVRPLHLSLTSAYHGSPTPIPSPAYVLTAGVYDRTQAQQAAKLIMNRFSLPGVEERITSVTGGDLLIKALTAHLVESGINPAETSVRHLVFTGGYTTTRTKQLLADLWQATVIDRYSMSEVFGGAVQVVPGTPFVFDIEVVPEVVDPYTLEPVREGVGVLILTSLYPFSQMMPMIRYYTGDLVEIAAPMSSTLAVRLVGRERRSVIEMADSGFVPLVLSGPLFDALDDLPDVAASPRFRGVASDEGMEIAGKLHFNVNSTKDDTGRVRDIRITIGLRYAPWLYPDRIRTIQTNMRNMLYERSPTLKKRVMEDSMTLAIDLVRGDQVAPYSMK